MTVVDRSRIAALLEEQTFSASDMVDQTQAVEMGRMMSANFIVTGKVIKAMGSYLVTAQMINTETSQIVGASKMSLPVATTDQAVKELYTPENYVVGSTFRSLLIPGWGQSFSEKPSHALLFGSLCAVGLGSSVATGIVQKKAYNEYTEFADIRDTKKYWDMRDSLVAGGLTIKQANSQLEEKETSLYANYSNKNKIFTIAAVTTGAIWTVNVIDAFILARIIHQHA